MIAFVLLLTIYSAVCTTLVRASAVTKAPTICPQGLVSSLDTCALLGNGLSPQACADLGGCVYNDTQCRRSPIPSLDELKGDWQNVSEVYNHPAVEGFWGGVATTTNLMSFKDGTFPPFSQGGESVILSVNGASVSSKWAQWYPFQVVRNSQIGDLNLTSTVRMGFEQNLVMLRLEIENGGNVAANPEIGFEFDSFWEYEAGTWPWYTPRPDVGGNFSPSFPDTSTVLTANGQNSTFSAVALSFEAQLTGVGNGQSKGTLSPRVAAGEKLVLWMAIAVGNTSATSTVATAKRALSNIGNVWDETLNLWSQRYQDVFTPNNTFFSGSLPVLVTDDTAISALWYQSIISILSTLRTNLLYPRVYSTIGPDEGTTIVYAWDTSLWSGILVLLDPDFLKEQVGIFLKLGAYNGYAVDYLSEQLVGPWYSANDFSIFTTMLRYVNMTGDYAWLNSPAGTSSTNLAQMSNLATHWQSLENPQFGLADYGGLSNLLEEVPTYTNMVPSLNAANAWMMTQYSYLLAATSNTTGTSAFLSLANTLTTKILSLYAGPGTGYWLTTYPNGTQQPVRHVYDFATISLYCAPALPPAIKTDMLAFLDKDLYTGHWLRALSLSDLAANVSMRPDHGSNGAYTAWPALAAAGASQLGDYNTMIRYLRAFSSVLSEASWAQSYQLIDPLGPAAAAAAEKTAQWAAAVSDWSGDYFSAGSGNGTAPAGLADRARISLPDQGESFLENNGACFADVVLSFVFGWAPDGKRVLLRDPGVARGGFRGSLVGVRGPGGGFWTVEAGVGGVVARRVQGGGRGFISGFGVEE